MCLAWLHGFDTIQSEMLLAHKSEANQERLCGHMPMSETQSVPERALHWSSVVYLILSGLNLQSSHTLCNEHCSVKQSKNVGQSPAQALQGSWSFLPCRCRWTTIMERSLVVLPTHSLTPQTMGIFLIRET